jgi:hypothetical protein
MRLASVHAKSGCLRGDTHIPRTIAAAESFGRWSRGSTASFTKIRNGATSTSSRTARAM